MHSELERDPEKRPVLLVLQFLPASSSLSPWVFFSSYLPCQDNPSFSLPFRYLYFIPSFHPSPWPFHPIKEPVLLFFPQPIEDQYVVLLHTTSTRYSLCKPEDTQADLHSALEWGWVHQSRSDVVAMPSCSKFLNIPNFCTYHRQE